METDVVIQLVLHYKTNRGQYCDSTMYHDYVKVKWQTKDLLSTMDLLYKTESMTVILGENCS